MRLIAPMRRNLERGYLLTEALVYIGAVFVLLGIGFVAMQRCIDNSILLRRNAHDIAQAVHIGEIWRSDIRKGTKTITWREVENHRVLQIETATNVIAYRYTEGAIYRRIGGGGWGKMLDRVRASSMHAEARAGLTAWYWDLELEPTRKGAVQAGRVRPLFTFLSTPQPSPSP